MKEEASAAEDNLRKRMFLKDQDINLGSEKLRNLEEKIIEMEAFDKEKAKILEKVVNLTAQLAQEKKERVIEGNEKDREKIYATERLRKEMLFQIKKTKANLLALNDEQLQTTTRLTIL